MEENRIFTIGHSTRSIEEFIRLLESCKIEVLVDIRSFPGSRRYPHFNTGFLQHILPEHNIQYFHLPTLGGRRKPNRDSVNTGWRNASFQGYADYMASAEFAAGMDTLCGMAVNSRVAYMCSEAMWWKCHRALVSDYLKVRGWKVMHIMSLTQMDEHPYTSPARLVQGKLFYD